MTEKYYNRETNTLILPYNFDNKLYDLPSDIKVIVFEEELDENEYSKFNQPVGHQGCEDINCPRNLPNSITHLTFGSDFDQQVDYLPNSITHLIFGSKFNQSVNYLPNSITHLTFGYWFSQPVNNLPNSITHLTFGR